MDEHARKLALLQAAGILVMLIAGFLMYLSYHKRPLNQSRLKVVVSELRSSASEGHLISDQLLQEKLRRVFLRVHLQMMVESAHKEVQNLSNSRVQPELTTQKQMAEAAGRQLEQNLSSLKDSYDEPQRTVELRDEFGEIFGRLRSLEQSLE
jgi:hypothetical protein